MMLRKNLPHTNKTTWAIVQKSISNTVFMVRTEINTGLIRKKILENPELSQKMRIEAIERTQMPNEIGMKKVEDLHDQ